MKVRRGTQAVGVLVCALAASLCGLSPAQALDEVVIHASPDGRGDGSVDRPASLVDALDRARRANAGLSDVTVELADGTYHLDQTLRIDGSLSGKNGHRVTLRNAAGARPILDAGRSIGGTWTAWRDGISRIRMSDAPGAIRELYVDGRRQTRAKSEPLQGGTVLGAANKFAVAAKALPEGFSATDGLLWHQTVNWRHYIVPVGSFDTQGSNLLGTFAEPAYSTDVANVNFEIRRDGLFWLENSLALLDQPGEWYYDKADGYLYLKPTPGTDLTTASVTTNGNSATLLDLAGTEQEPLSDVEIRGLTFAHTGWTQVDTMGMVSPQANVVVTSQGADQVHMPAAVSVNRARNVTITDNDFTHLGASAITANDAIADITITRNTFQDLSGAAVQLGNAHDRRQARGVPERITVANNVVRQTGRSFYGSVAISSMFARDLKITHNDISDTPYTAISTGWDWSKETADYLKNISIDHNRIDRYMSRLTDGGAIYSMSAHTNSTYSSNYVGSSYGNFALYHDDSSSGFVDERNVIAVDSPDHVAYNFNQVNNLTVRHNWSTSGAIVNFMPAANVTIADLTVVQATKWPKEARSVIKQAGLESSQADVMTRVNVVTPSPSVNLRASGLRQEWATLYQPDVRLPLVAPRGSVHLESDGVVVANAGDFSEYDGLLSGKPEQPAEAIIAWPHDEAYFLAPYPNLTQQANIAELKGGKGWPSIGYAVRVPKGGTYRVMVAGRSGEAQVTIDGTPLAKTPLSKAFGWVQMGDPITLAKGKHQVRLALGPGVDFDRLALVRVGSTWDSTLVDGYTGRGPINSERTGLPHRSVLDVPAELDQASVDLATNYALGRRVVASSTGRPSDADSLKLTDANEGTSLQLPWAASSYWVIDLGSPQAPSSAVLTRPYADAPFHIAGAQIFGLDDLNQLDRRALLGSVPAELDTTSRQTTITLDASQAHRYVMVHQPNASDTLLSELELLGTVPFPTGENAAAGSAITQTSDSMARIADPKVLGDGLLSGDFAHVTPAAGNPWLVLDLGTERTLQSIQLTRPYAQVPGHVANLEVWADTDADFSSGAQLIAKVPASYADGTSTDVVLPISNVDKFRYLKLSKQDAWDLLLTEVQAVQR